MAAITPIAAYFLYMTLSSPNSHFCNSQDRNVLSTIQSQPVCALYTGDCSSSVSGFCQKTFSNAQAACQENNVLAYTIGECNQALVQACSASAQTTFDDKVCSFSVQRRLGGASQDVVKASVSASDACKSDNTAFFVKSDCSSVETIINNICSKDKRAQAEQCSVVGTEAINCVYYTGDDCQGQVCRKTQKTDCSLCKDASVLFFTDGACENGFMETLKISARLLQQDDDPNGLDLSNDDEVVEAEIVDDGNANLNPVESSDAEPEVENTEDPVAPQDDPDGWDLSNDDEAFEAEIVDVDGSDAVNPVESSDAAPEVENDEESNQDPVAPEDDPDGWDLSNDDEAFEAEIIDVDGSDAVDPVESSNAAPEVENDEESNEDQVALEDDPNGLDLSNDDEAFEAEIIDVDGSDAVDPVESGNADPVAPEDDPDGLDLSNDDEAFEAEIIDVDGSDAVDPVESDSAEPEVENTEDPVAPVDDPDGWDLSNDDEAFEAEIIDVDGSDAVDPAESDNAEPEIDNEAESTSNNNSTSSSSNSTSSSSGNDSSIKIIIKGFPKNLNDIFKDLGLGKK